MRGSPLEESRGFNTTKCTKCSQEVSSLMAFTAENGWCFANYRFYSSPKCSNDKAQWFRFGILAYSFQGKLTSYPDNGSVVKTCILTLRLWVKAKGHPLCDYNAQG